MTRDYRADPTAYLVAIRDARLAVLRTAVLIAEPALFSVGALFAALGADGELVLRGVRGATIPSRQGGTP